MAHGLVDPHHATPPPQSHSSTEPVALGAELLEWIQEDIPHLKPKMRKVAEHLLRHSASLHLEGIQNLALHTRTAPATIVRLAKRYGFAGFSDLKVAFLPGRAADAMHAPATSLPARTASAICGAALLARIRQDLPRLSPKMRNVGEHLLRHSSTLHQQRIKVLAQQADTIPATIVRLAKRYGFVGFHDLKLAFLPAAQAPGSSPATSAALAEIERWALCMQSMRALVEHGAFQQQLQALHAAPHIAVYAAQAGDQALAHYLAQRLALWRPGTILADTGPCAPDGYVLLHVCTQAQPAISLHTRDRKTKPGAEHMRLVLPGGADMPSSHCAFTLVDALCAALHAHTAARADLSNG